MKEASEAQEFEQAALERNRLRAVRSLLERQRVANESVGTLDAVAVAVDGTDANAQVFQVRDGVLSRPPVLLPRQRGRARTSARSPRSSSSSTTAARRSIPPQVDRPGARSPDREALAELLGERRGGRSRCAPPSAATSAASSSWPSATRALALDQEKLKAERRRQQRVEALDGLQEALGLDVAAAADRVLRHLEPDGHAHGRLDGRLRGRRAEEVRLPPLHDPRHGRGRPDDFAAMEEVLGRRLAQWESQQDLSPARPRAQRVLRDAAEPDRDRRRPGPARPPGCARSQGFRERGVAVVSLAKRIEEVFMPGPPAPIVLAHDTPELQLLQRVRDEAHRFAITHHRIAPRPGDDDVDPRRRCPASGRRASARCSTTSARPRRCSPPSREELEARARACRARSRASSTPSCTGRAADGPGHVATMSDMTSHQTAPAAGHSVARRAAPGSGRADRASRTSSSSPASPAPASRPRWPCSRTPATSASTTCRRR